MSGYCTFLQFFRNYWSLIGQDWIASGVRRPRQSWRSPPNHSNSKLESNYLEDLYDLYLLESSSGSIYHDVDSSCNEHLPSFYRLQYCWHKFNTCHTLYQGYCATLTTSIGYNNHQNLFILQYRYYYPFISIIVCPKEMAWHKGNWWPLFVREFFR